MFFWSGRRVPRRSRRESLARYHDEHHSPYGRRCGRFAPSGVLQQEFLAIGSLSAHVRYGQTMAVSFRSGVSYWYKLPRKCGRLPPQLRTAVKFLLTGVSLICNSFAYIRRSSSKVPVGLDSKVAIRPRQILLRGDLCFFHRVSLFAVVWCSRRPPPA